jgi:hypothetical protein
MSKAMRFSVTIVALLPTAMGFGMLGAPCVEATTLAKMDLAALARAAEVVVDGRCIGLQARREGGTIWTFAEFDVKETLAGPASSEARVTVRLAGGQIGHLRESVDGVPRFAVGEEAVLFLERTSAGDYGISGWTQGTFRVKRAAGVAEATVTQDSAGFAMFDPRTRQFETDAIRRMTMTEFRERLAAAIAVLTRKRVQR